MQKNNKVTPPIAPALPAAGCRAQGVRRRAGLAAGLAILLLAGAFAAAAAEPALSAPRAPGVVPDDAPSRGAGPAAGGSVEALYAAATAALDEGQPARAREMLEEIVSRRPEFAGAWLDLALAAYRAGDVEAAIEHLAYLRTHFVLPPVLSAQIDDWNRRWQQTGVARDATDAWQGEVTFGVGYDTNVNSGLARKSLSLTLPDGNLDFPVGKASRPIADTFALLGLTAWGPAQPLWQGRVRPVVLLRGKRMLSETDYDSLDLQAGGIYVQPAETVGSWRLGGFLLQDRLGGRVLSNGARLDVQRIRPWSDCQLATGAELEMRQASADADMTGAIYSLNGGVSCPLPGEASFAGQLRVGRTQPRADWPGGPKNGIELALQYSRPLPGGRRVDLGWRASWLNDTEGYSSLLHDNAERRVQRQGLSAALRQPLGAEWDAVFSVEVLRQKSNLELFEYDTRLFLLSFVRRFG